MPCTTMLSGMPSRAQRAHQLEPRPDDADEVARVDARRDAPRPAGSTRRRRAVLWRSTSVHVSLTAPTAPTPLPRRSPARPGRRPRRATRHPRRCRGAIPLTLTGLVLPAHRSPRQAGRGRDAARLAHPRLPAVRERARSRHAAASSTCTTTSRDARRDARVRSRSTSPARRSLGRIRVTQHVDRRCRRRPRRCGHRRPAASQSTPPSLRHGRPIDEVVRPLQLDRQSRRRVYALRGGDTGGQRHQRRAPGATTGGRRITETGRCRRPAARTTSRPRRPRPAVCTSASTAVPSGAPAVGERQREVVGRRDLREVADRAERAQPRPRMSIAAARSAGSVRRRFTATQPLTAAPRSRG